MDGFKVTGAAVALPTADGGIRYLYRSGVVLPREGFTEAGLNHAKSVGLIDLVTVEDQAQDDGPKPIDKMTAAELKAYAEEHGIDLGEAKNKPDVLAAIQAHEAAHADPADPPTGDDANGASS